MPWLPSCPAIMIGITLGMSQETLLGSTYREKWEEIALDKVSCVTMWKQERLTRFASADNMRKIFAKIEKNHYVPAGTAGHGFDGFFENSMARATTVGQPTLAILQ